MKRLAMLLLLTATNGFGGGTGGGGVPPAFEVDHARMMELHAGALGDNLIRVKRPGENSIYMKPMKDSISSYSLKARALPSGGETLFRALSGFEVRGTDMSRSMTRTIGSMPGILPILSDDLALELKPIIEVVPMPSLDDATVQ
jgi:hypothetical protein